MLQKFSGETVIDMLVKSKCRKGQQWAMRLSRDLKISGSNKQKAFKNEKNTESREGERFKCCKVHRTKSCIPTWATDSVSAYAHNSSEYPF